MVLKRIRYVVGAVAAMSLILILLLSTFEIAMYSDFDFYKKEYQKYEVLSDLDMEMKDVMYVTQEMMAYLKGERESLQVITMIEGERQDFFDEQDRFHMKEVQMLFLGGLKLRAGATVVFFLCVLWLVICLPKWKWIPVLCRSYQGVLGVVSFLALTLGIWAVYDFNTLFIRFHELFFDNDLWIFDPAEDYMIRMLPEGLFSDFVFRIGSFFLAGLLGILIITIFARVIYKKISDTYE